MKNLLRLSFIFFIISLIAIDGKCQNTTVSIGNWREHVPYNKAIEVAEDNNGLIYCATQFGVFTYSKSDGELNRLSRLKELSDQEVNTIRYDKPTGVLLIAYANSNIDMIYSDKTVVNLSDIKQKNIVGGKQINSIYFQNGFAYLGCGFGIVVIDISRREIKNLDPKDLFDLDIMVYSPYWIDYAQKDVKQFNSDFLQKFLTEPFEKSYAWTGYDIAYYFLSGIAMYGKDFIVHPEMHYPDLLQTEFDFIRNDAGDGFENQNLFLVRYTKDYEIKLVDEH